MLRKDIEDVVRKIWIRIELSTYSLGVPFAITFVLAAHGFQKKYIYPLLVGALIGVFVTLVYTPIRKVRLENFFKRLEKANLSPQELEDIRVDIHNLPMREVIVIQIRWIFGLTSAMFYFFTQVAFEWYLFLPSIMVYFMISVLNGLGAYLITETSLADFVSKEYFKDTMVRKERVSFYSLGKKILLASFGIIWNLSIATSYLLYVYTKEIVKPQYIEVTILLLFFFSMTFTIGLSMILANNLKKSTQMITNVMEKFSIGNLQAEATLSSSDEIGLLSYSMNSFSRKISLTLEQIKEGSKRLSNYSQKLDSDSERALSEIQSQSKTISDLYSSTESLNSSSGEILNKSEKNLSQIEKTNALFSELTR
ncbi:MAG: methyl-accepting chemotaxis protein, partial [Leptospiraceae bacterium]|nr:methyl-accepting chemotaxis protein [Leptospiraceae bacterium]